LKLFYKGSTFIMYTCTWPWYRIHDTVVVYFHASVVTCHRDVILLLIQWHRNYEKFSSFTMTMPVDARMSMFAGLKRLEMLVVIMHWTYQVSVSQWKLVAF